MPMVRTVLAAVFALFLMASVALQAQTPARTAPQPAQSERTRVEGQPPVATPEAPPPSDLDARSTREELRQLMQRFPPDLARILRLDPSLLQNKDYLSQYPALAAYLARHPEIAHNPRYFFDFVRDSYDWNEPADARTQAINMWRNMFEAAGAFCIFLAVSALLAWLVRTFIDYRRWLRVSRIQTEVHNKLLERFSSTGDLLAYVQSSAGRRFLESAPIPLDPGPRSIAAPFGRILWSVQAGVVLTVLGLGFQLVSVRVIDDVGQPLTVIGMLAMALGVGFILSGVVSYLLSRRLGLLEPMTPAAPERGDSPLT
jgi:hypothetical protein